ncbi:MAG: hypothetical protein ACLGH0_05520, partial [Thermoanaerobaculia bacterium]
MKILHPCDSEPLLLGRLALHGLPPQLSGMRLVRHSFTPEIIEHGLASMRRAALDPRPSVFLILHEYATSLDFGPHLVLTPHATTSLPLSFVPVAYLPYTIGSPSPFATRPLRASFRGAVATDPTGVRARMLRAMRSELRCVVEDTGSFHDAHDPATRASHSRRYVELLATSRIALCP